MSHVGVSLVAGDSIKTWTAYDLIHCLTHTYEMGHAITIDRGGGTLLHDARQKACKRLYDAGCDYIFCVDDDMRIPTNAITGLLEHDVDVVGANCAKRKQPVGPTARRKNAWFSMDPDASEAVFPDPDILGLEEVHTIGFGVVLIKRSVFERIEWPWFDQPWIPDAQGFVGEDTFFCRRCHDADIPVHIDHGLSWVVRHVGDYEYSMHDVLATREAAEAGLITEGV